MSELTEFQYDTLQAVKKGLDIQFEVYTWGNMIDDLNLTQQQKIWAKQHLTYKAVVIEDEYSSYDKAQGEKET